MLILCKIQEKAYLYLCAYALIGVRKSTFNVQCSMFNAQCYCSALIRNTFYADGAAMLQDNLATKGKADAAAGRLGGEEGNESVFQYIGRHAATVVLDTNTACP